MLLLATEPRRKLRDAVGTDRPQLTTAKAGHVEASCGDSRLNCDLAVRLRLEATSALARDLKTSTDCLSPLALRRIIQVANEDVMGSLTAVCRGVDREVHELSTTGPTGDPIEQMEGVVQMYEEEMLEWEQTRTVHPDPRCGSGSSTRTDRPEAGRDSGEDSGGERGRRESTTGAGRCCGKPH